MSGNERAENEMSSQSVDAAALAADTARQQVSATIDELQDRLNPRRIIDETLERVQSSSRAVASQVSDAARAHPLAIGATVAALGLALLARNGLANATVDMGDTGGDYTDYDDDYAELGSVAKPPAARLAALAEQTGGVVQANPGVSIIFGLVAGAALGALLPVSDGERRTLGQTGSRISAAARAAARCARDEFDAAGLSVERVRTMASEATQKAKSAAHSVVDAAKAEFKT